MQFVNTVQGNPKLDLSVPIYMRFGPEISGPTKGGVVLRSKLVDVRCRVRFPVTLVDLTLQNFPRFSPKLA